MRSTPHCSEVTVRLAAAEAPAGKSLLHRKYTIDL